MQATSEWLKQQAGASPTNAALPIEVVIPFTSVTQVRCGLRIAERLCSGLHAVVRIVRVVIVPFPLDLDRPAVPVRSMIAEMRTLSCDLPLTIDMRLSRDRVPTLVRAILTHPLILVASKRRFWQTKEEKLADELKRAGYEVLVSYAGDTNA